MKHRRSGTQCRHGVICTVRTLRGKSHNAYSILTCCWRGSHTNKVHFCSLYSVYFYQLSSLSFFPAKNASLASFFLYLFFHFREDLSRLCRAPLSPSIPPHLAFVLFRRFYSFNAEQKGRGEKKPTPGQSSKQITHVQHILRIAVPFIVRIP